METIKMATQTRLAKSTIFGVPSLETATRIDDSDKVAGLEAARYRCSARLRGRNHRAGSGLSFGQGLRPHSEVHFFGSSERKG